MRKAESVTSVARRSDAHHVLRSPWLAVLFCFIAQNAALGLAYGTFGPLLKVNESHFGVSRTVAAFGMSLVTLVMSLLAPIAGVFLQRHSVRLAMAGGALLGATGYFGIALLPSFEGALVMYAMIGASACVTGILGPVVVIGRWFESKRGQALSIVNLPLAIFFTPYIVAELLPTTGRFPILTGVGIIMTVLAALLLMLPERPDDGQPTPRVEPNAGQEADPRSAALANKDGDGFFKSMSFWLLSLAIGAQAGSAVAFMVHIIPFGEEKGMSLPEASLLISTYAGAGIVGTLLAGWICDRIGARLSLLISAICQSALWISFTLMNGQALFVLAAVMGAWAVPVVTYHGAVLGELFGKDRMGRAMGFSYIIKLPFLFAFPPLIGFLFDQSGTYRFAFLAAGAMMGIACIALAGMIKLTGGPRISPRDA